ncbi:MAG: hypothetical protein IJ641_04995 [Lachnospiraceae bacterium]|nr:hypothetical protein [Lachnospiraceae bacterium]
MKKHPLLIFMILTILTVSIPGAVISVRDMNFSYPAAAVMIQTIKNRQFARIVYPDDIALPDRMMYHAKNEDTDDNRSEETANEKQDVKAEAGSIESDASEQKEMAAPEKKDADSRTDEGTADTAEPVREDVQGEAKEDMDKETDEDTTEDDNIEEDIDEEDDEEEEDESYEDDNEVPEEKGFTTVDNDYFTDACFIGDSRVKGLGLYSDLPGMNYGTVGMQLYRIFDKKVISTDVGKVTIPEMIALDPEYGKIYMGFGLNEMGWGNDEMFANYYYGLIDYLKAVRPDAVLYIMGIIHVTAEEEQKSALYKNSEIDKRNELLRQIADNEGIYYLDLNEVFTDEYGRLAPGDSFDGIHIKASAINKWADYLRTHAIV